MDTIFVLGLIAGFLGGALGFYLLYYFEKKGTWNDVVKTKRDRKILTIVSLIFIFSGGLGAFALTRCNDANLTMLGVLVPVAIWLGLYFLVVALFYKQTDGS